jgi:3-oxoacyl-[acyl-carrier protein] reductase
MKKTVLITGGNKGIGKETTRLFLENGFRVIVAARSASGLTDFPAGENLILKSVDLSDPDKIPGLVAECGGIDILVNNAAEMLSLPYNSYPQERMEHILRLNLITPIKLIEAVSEHMLNNRSGRIVNVSSVAGQIGHPDVWYGITKAGLINATKSFAKLLGPSGIVINAVAPGPVETNMLAVIPEARKKAVKESVYTGRFARPEEIAATIFWLAVESPEYINGTCIDLNNGSFPR